MLQISTDKTRLDIALIHNFLAHQSTWAQRIPRETLERAIDNSLCFGGYVDGAQVAFARVISDFATFANLVDVFVVPECRGRGYAESLVREVLGDPRLQGLRRFTLATGSAHGLYAKFGFAAPATPRSLMERYDPGIYG